MDKSSKQKINSETVDLDQMELTDIHREFYPTTAGYTFFSSSHGTFTKIDHVLGHITHLKRKRTTSG